MEHIVWTWWTTDTMTMEGGVQDHLHGYHKIKSVDHREACDTAVRGRNGGIHLKS